MGSGAGLIEAFIESVATAFREMAGVETSLSEAIRAAGNEEYLDITASLPLAAVAGAGRLILSFPERTAAALACRVLNDETDAQMIRDCAGEMANVIAGQAKTILVGTPAHFTLSTPTVVTDKQSDVTAGWWLLRFNSEIGKFILYIHLPY